MNNAQVIIEDASEKPTESVIYRERAERLTEILEAIQNIAASSYWKVLEKYVFDVELSKSKRRLEIESDTPEIFRLQGEVRMGRKYHLEKLLTKYRDELTTIRKKI